MAQTVTRVAGGGNTFITLTSNGYPIRLLSRCNDQPGTVNGNPTPIQGIGDKYPFEIATGYSQTAGRLTLDVYQVWGKDGWVSIWDTNIADLQDPTRSSANFIMDYVNKGGSDLNRHSRFPATLVEMLELQRTRKGFVPVSKVECGADGKIVRIKRYQGCVITNINAGETFANDTMVPTVSVEMMYTHYVISKASEMSIKDGWRHGKEYPTSNSDWDSGNPGQQENVYDFNML